MSEPTVPRSFDPEYGTAVRRILPAIVALMAFCGLVFLLLASSSATGLWLGLGSFGVGAGFAGLYFWFLIYREIEFREDGIVVRRYLFPDVEGSYGEVEGVSSMGFRLGGYPVACHTMRNADELREILGDLRERGVIESDRDGGLTRDFRANLSATVRATLLGVVLWLVIDAAGLVPASLPDGIAPYGVILVTLLVGAPLIKRVSSE